MSVHNFTAAVVSLQTPTAKSDGLHHFTECIDLNKTIELARCKNSDAHQFSINVTYLRPSFTFCADFRTHVTSQVWINNGYGHGRKYDQI